MIDWGITMMSDDDDDDDDDDMSTRMDHDFLSLSSFIKSVIKTVY